MYLSMGRCRIEAVVCILFQHLQEFRAVLLPMSVLTAKSASISRHSTCASRLEDITTVLPPFSGASASRGPVVLRLNAAFSICNCILAIDAIFSIAVIQLCEALFRAQFVIRPVRLLSKVEILHRRHKNPRSRCNKPCCFGRWTYFLPGKESTLNTRCPMLGHL